MVERHVESLVSEQEDGDGLRGLCSCLLAWSYRRSLTVYEMVARRELWAGGTLQARI